MFKKHSHPMDFDNWMEMVNDAVEAYCGLSRDDLPDYPYRDCYDAGESPQHVGARPSKPLRVRRI